MGNNDANNRRNDLLVSHDAAHSTLWAGLDKRTALQRRPKASKTSTNLGVASGSGNPDRANLPGAGIRPDWLVSIRIAVPSVVGPLGNLLRLSGKTNSRPKS